MSKNFEKTQRSFKIQKFIHVNPYVNKQYKS